jgi:hypothetical protein
VLLSKLDLRGEYSVLLKELATALPPVDSAFSGLWVYRPDGGGFGTIALQLYPDGSGTMAGDVGAVPVVWTSESSDVVDIEPPPLFKEVAGEQATEMSFSLTLEDNQLLLTNKDGERGLKREATGPERHTEWRYPILLWFEHVWLTPAEDLILQINRMRLRVSLKQLVEAVEQNRIPDQPNDLNVLKWSDSSELSEIPVPKDSIEIAKGERRVNPGYTTYHQKTWL